MHSTLFATYCMCSSDCTPGMLTSTGYMAMLFGSGILDPPIHLATVCVLFEQACTSSKALFRSQGHGRETLPHAHNLHTYSKMFTQNRTSECPLTCPSYSYACQAGLQVVSFEQFVPLLTKVAGIWFTAQLRRSASIAANTPF